MELAYLNALICIRHHGNEKVDEHDDWHQKVHAKHYFKQDAGPFGLIKLFIARFDLQIVPVG